MNLNCEELLQENNECEECENWKQRGDNLFDELDQAYKSISSLKKTLEADVEMREMNGKLRALLRNNNIEFEE